MTSSGASQKINSDVISGEEIQRKLEVFRKEFISSFHDQLKQVYNVAKGKDPVNIDYGLIGNIVKETIQSLVENSTQTIPIVGPFVGKFLVTFPLLLYETYQEGKSREEAAGQHEEQVKLGKRVVDSTIEEVAYEITRIFEYQISMIASEGHIGMLAEFAVAKIFDEATKNKNQVAFHRNDLLKALLVDTDAKLLTKMKWKFLNDYEKPIIIEKEKWDLCHIFTKPGL